MPFTISHTAAVLPFARFLNRWRALSAVVIGSMVPDFIMLVPWDAQREDSHSIRGLFLFCLPVGMLSYWLFEYIVKPAAWEVLPDAAHERSRALAVPDPILRPLQWLIASLGILAGAFTHLAWDGFTHEGARGVRMFPVLDDSVGIAGHSLYAFQFAQHFSSVFGLAVVVYLIAAAMRAPTAVTAPVRALGQAARRRWMAGYILTAVLIAAVSVRLTTMTPWWERTWWSVPDAIAVGGMRGLLLSMLAVSVLLSVCLRMLKKPRG